MIRFRSARPAPSNELTGRAGIWPATVRQAADWAIGAALASATARQERLGNRGGRSGSEAEPIASAAAISRAAVAEIGMPSEEVPGDTTDRARAAVAVAAPPAWDLEAGRGSVVAAAAVGAGRRLDRRKKS